MNSIGGIVNKVNYLASPVEKNVGRNIPTPKALLEGAKITFQKNKDGTYINNDIEKGEIREMNGAIVMVYFDKSKYGAEKHTSKVDIKV